MSFSGLMPLYICSTSSIPTSTQYLDPQCCLSLCSLEISSLNKTIRITAKSTKRIREALQPVLGKYSINMELALLRRVRVVGQ